MLRLSFVSAWARKRRFLGVLVAVALGVTFLSGTLVLSTSIQRGFSAAFENAKDGVDVAIQGDVRASGELGFTSSFDAAVADMVAQVPGVREVAAVLRGRAQIVAKDGTLIGGGGPPTAGAAWVVSPALNAFTLVEGHPPTTAGEVVIDRGSAKSGGFEVGDETTVLTPSPVEVVIVGVASFGNSDSVGGSTFAWFTADEAQRLYAGGPPKATEILVAGEDGTTQPELAASISAALPEGFEVITGAERLERQESAITEDFLGFFESALLTFSGIALLVAALSIFNTFSILTAQRAREAGLLRAVGASRRQILLGNFMEAFVVGVVGSGLGIALGIGVAGALTDLLESFGPGLPAGDVVVLRSDVMVGVFTGLVVTIVGATVPAIRASRVSPLAALRDIAQERRDVSVARAVLGALVTSAGVGAVLTGVRGEGDVELVGMGGIALLLGVVILGPVVARPVARLLGTPLRLRGVVGELAVRNAARNPRRTAATATSLLVGASVVTVFTVIASSFAASIEDAIDRSFGGDLVVEASGFSGPGLPESFVTDLRALSEVAEVAGLGFGVAVVDGEPTDLGFTEIGALASVATFEVVRGTLPDVDGSGITVSEEMLERRGWQLGESIEMTFADGAAETLTITAVHDDRAIGGPILLPTALWARHVTQPAYVLALVDLAQGVDVAEGRRAVAEVARPLGRPAVRDRKAFIESQAGQLVVVLNVVYGLLAISVIIALVGIDRKSVV